jgi:hypothetical protein
MFLPPMWWCGAARIWVIINCISRPGIRDAVCATRMPAVARGWRGMGGLSQPWLLAGPISVGRRPFRRAPSGIAPRIAGRTKPSVVVGDELWWTALSDAISKTTAHDRDRLLDPRPAGYRGRRRRPSGAGVPRGPGSPRSNVKCRCPPSARMRAGRWLAPGSRNASRRLAGAARASPRTEAARAIT